MPCSLPGRSTKCCQVNPFEGMVILSSRPGGSSLVFPWCFFVRCPVDGATDGARLFPAANLIARRLECSRWTGELAIGSMAARATGGADADLPGRGGV